MADIGSIFGASFNAGYERTARNLEQTRLILEDKQHQKNAQAAVMAYEAQMTEQQSKIKSISEQRQALLDAQGRGETVDPAQIRALDNQTIQSTMNLFKFENDLRMQTLAADPANPYLQKMMQQVGAHVGKQLDFVVSQAEASQKQEFERTMAEHKAELDARTAATKHEYNMEERALTQDRQDARSAADRASRRELKVLELEHKPGENPLKGRTSDLNAVISTELPKVLSDMGYTKDDVNNAYTGPDGKPVAQLPSEVVAKARTEARNRATAILQKTANAPDESAAPAPEAGLQEGQAAGGAQAPAPTQVAPPTPQQAQSLAADLTKTLGRTPTRKEAMDAWTAMNSGK